MKTHRVAETITINKTKVTVVRLCVKEDAPSGEAAKPKAERRYSSLPLLIQGAHDAKKRK